MLLYESLQITLQLAANFAFRARFFYLIFFYFYQHFLFHISFMATVFILFCSFHCCAQTQNHFHHNSLTRLMQMLLLFGSYSSNVAVVTFQNVIVICFLFVYLHVLWET